MACETCTHTMQRIGTAQFGEPLFWCPRCGSVKVEAEGAEAEAPKLVERCREFEKKNVEGAAGDGSQDAPWINADWTGLGIAESIRLPEDRPNG